MQGGKMKKIILAICGASGVQYGLEILKTLNEAGIETHLIMSEWAEELIKEETTWKIEKVKAMASRVYDYKDMKASISSSSFLVDGMIICPATVKTVSEIANAFTENLIARAADNMLKTRKPLIICIRETPLSTACLKNLYKLSIYGAIIMPLSPGFYHKPKDIKELFDFITGKVLDLFGIKNDKFKRWKQ